MLRVSERIVRRMLARSELPGVVIGRQWRLDLDALGARLGRMRRVPPRRNTPPRTEEDRIAALGRELHDLQAALQAVLDRWSPRKAANFDPDAQAVLADVERLARGVEELLEPEHETPGERAGGGARPVAANAIVPRRSRSCRSTFPVAATTRSRPP
jgi:hypothetical protein